MYVLSLIKICHHSFAQQGFLFVLKQVLHLRLFLLWNKVLHSMFFFSLDEKTSTGIALVKAIVCMYWLGDYAIYLDMCGQTFL